MWMCERCYCRLPTARERKPVGEVVRIKDPPRPRPSAYQQFVEAVWSKLEDRTGHTVHYMGPSHLAAYCPVCRTGTLGVHFANLTSGPRVTCRCSNGCSARFIAEALQ